MLNCKSIIKHLVNKLFEWLITYLSFELCRRLEKIYDNMINKSQF